jgi:hypothetical protein
LNNPLRLVDPEGLESPDCSDPGGCDGDLLGLGGTGFLVGTLLGEAVGSFVESEDDPGYSIDLSVSYLDTGTSAELLGSQMTVAQGDELVNPGTGQIVGTLPGASPSDGIIVAASGLVLGTVSFVAGAEEATSTSVPGFLVSPDGTAFPVPEGAAGPFSTDNGLGIQYNGGQGGNGLASNVTDVRFMDPTGQYPGGYVNYGSQQVNGGWQTVNPSTGAPISPDNPMWHIPIQ